MHTRHRQRGRSSFGLSPTIYVHWYNTQLGWLPYAARVADVWAPVGAQYLVEVRRCIRTRLGPRWKRRALDAMPARGRQGTRSNFARPPHAKLMIFLNPYLITRLLTPVVTRSSASRDREDLKLVTRCGLVLNFRCEQLQTQPNSARMVVGGAESAVAVRLGEGHRRDDGHILLRRL